MTRMLPESRKNTALAMTRQYHKKSHAKERVAKGFSSYTVVSAVYNVEKYLHDFFTSMVRQTLDFENNITLIMVDDGSTDRSAEIIKSWQKRYPYNIKYLYKENGGQASARNMGLPLVKTEWVTFTDPDDFVSCNFFCAIDALLKLNSNIDISSVACPVMILFGDGNKPQEHALNSRFHDNNSIIQNKVNSSPTGSATCMLFSVLKLNHANIRFDERLVTSFEDGKFALEVSLRYSSAYTLFAKQAIYYYRKRTCSTISNAWNDVRHYIEDVYFGEMDALNITTQHGVNVAASSVLYSLSWHVKYFLNREDRVSVLGNLVSAYITLLKFIFEKINAMDVYNFKHSGMWFLQKMCIIQFLKTTVIAKNYIYIDHADVSSHMVLLYYFGDERAVFKIGDKALQPIVEKNRIHTFCGCKAVMERRIYLDLKVFDPNLTFLVKMKGKENRYILKGKQYNSLTLAEIFKAYDVSKNEDNLSKYHNCWIFMDRDIWADDSAEVLYHYVKKNHPEINSWFVVRKSTKDWARLKSLGDTNLIDFMSSAYSEALGHCKYFISSQADLYLFNIKNKKMFSFDFVFLQHGVIKDDISSWLNSKTLSLFITSTYKEYNYIAGESKFKFSPKEVFLCGLPRHDRLLEDSNSEKKIVIMPTWRKQLSDVVSGVTDEKRPNQLFFGSKYYIYWKSFLQSDVLHDLVCRFGYRIILCPHINLKNFIHHFEVPECIEIFEHGIGRLSDIFRSSSIMITDSSSAAFEMAYMYKSVLYFQFDMDQVFGGGHIAQKGYFDYERDGFGPVAETEEALLHELEILLKNDGKPARKYRRRMENTFPFRDGRCCERVYNAICRLEEPQRDYFSEISCLYDQAVSASRSNDTIASIELWKKFYDVSSQEVQESMGPWFHW